MKGHKTLNTNQLAELLQLKNEQISIDDCVKAIDIVMRGIAEGMANGKRTELRGFGSFKAIINNPRAARNPRTGDPLLVGYRGYARFKPGKELKQRVNAI